MRVSLELQSPSTVVAPSATTTTTTATATTTTNAAAVRRRSFTAYWHTMRTTTQTRDESIVNNHEYDCGAATDRKDVDPLIMLIPEISFIQNVDAQAGILSVILMKRVLMLIQMLL